MYNFISSIIGTENFIDSSIFSFKYNDRLIRSFDKTNITEAMNEELSFKEVVIKSDVDRSLTAYLKIRLFKEFNAIEWVMSFTNNGNKDSYRISEILPMDLRFCLDSQEALLWQSLRGDECAADSFFPIERTLLPNQSFKLAPIGGRSSNGSFPFFNLLENGKGVIAAIGWTGQWMASLERDESKVYIKAGMEKTDLYLKPGESIRTPKILLMPWAGESDEAHNKFRKLMRKHFSPKLPDNEEITLPVVLQNFDRYSYNVPEWITEAGQLQSVRNAAKCEHFNAYWLDAAWFVGGFPKGVGNFRMREGFPNGLKPISEEAHKNGMKFVVWIEPERMIEGTDTYNEILSTHPEWLLSIPEHNIPKTGFKGSKYHILDIGNEEARKWLTDRIIKFIENNGVDIYRQDFNIDPLNYWMEKDEEGRNGITEIKYIEGLYKFWDSLHERFPGMLIDNCSSGGRRIDIETCSRAVPLWRSDTGCRPVSENWKPDMYDQNQAMSLSKYLVYHSSCSWSEKSYAFRSAATMGIAANFDVLNDNFSFEDAKSALVEFHRLKKYWSGDFYQLTPVTLDQRHWVAYQFNDSENKSGMALIFRRDESPYNSMPINFKVLLPDRRYKLVLTDENRRSEIKYAYGTELMEGYEVIQLEKKSSLIIEYEAK